MRKKKIAEEAVRIWKESSSMDYLEAINLAKNYMKERIRMTKEEAVEQLECIKYHSESMRDKEDPEDVWHKDIAALTMAIKILKKDLKGLQS